MRIYKPFIPLFTWENMNHKDWLTNIFRAKPSHYLKLVLNMRAFFQNLICRNIIDVVSCYEWMLMLGWIEREGVQSWFCPLSVGTLDSYFSSLVQFPHLQNKDNDNSTQFTGLLLKMIHRFYKESYFTDLMQY